MSNQSDYPQGCVTALLGLFIFMPIFTALRGFVLHRLWAWFVVPLGVPAIGIAHAVGLAMLVGFLKMSQHDFDQESDDEPLARLIGQSIGYVVVYGFVLLAGYLIHGLMLA